MSSYLVFLNGSKAFQPIDLVNNVLWLDAKDSSTITATANAVSAWADKSGAGNNVTGSNKPTYSATSLGGALPGITGNGSSNVLSCAGTIIPSNSDWTLSMVCSANAISGNSILAGFGNVAIQAQQATAGRLRIFNSSELVEVNQDMVQSTPYYITMVYRAANTGAIDLYINGLIVGTLASGTYNFTSGTFTLFSALAGAVFGNCTISEVIVYTVALSPANINKIHAYLSAKWAFAANPSYQYDVVLAFGDSLMQGHYGGINRTVDNTGDRRAFQYGRDNPHNTAQMMLFNPPQSPGNAGSGNVALSVNLTRDVELVTASGRAPMLMPEAIGGTGFSTNDWNPGNTTYETMLARVNAAFSGNLPAGSVLRQINIQIGSNDNGHYTTAQYNAKITALVNDIRLRMTGAANVPITFGPMLPGGAVTDPLIDASLKAVPDNNSNCDYVWGNNLTSVSGDNVHPDTASARLLGHKHFGTLPMAGTPLVHVDCNRDSSIIRAYQVLTGTATGTSGASTIAISNSQALFIFAGMRIRLGGTDVYKVVSVATSGTTTVTISGTLSTNYVSVTAEVERISQWSDISGNANHFVQATVANQALYNAGAVFGVSNPNGLNGIPYPHFNGSSQFMQCNAIDLRVVGNGGWAFTFVAQRNTSGTVNAPVCYKNQSGGADAFGVDWDSNGHVDYFPGGTGSGTPASFTGVATPATSAPHIISMVKYNNSTNGFISYIDNVIDVTTTDTADYSLLQTGTQLWLGANRNTGNGPQFSFNGIIAEYMFYTGSLTPAQVLYNHKVLGAKYNITV